MAKYSVTINCVASFTALVDASDEGMALDKARSQAEDADMSQFILGIEKESQCECVGE